MGLLGAGTAGARTRRARAEQHADSEFPEDDGTRYRRRAVRGRIQKGGVGFQVCGLAHASKRISAGDELLGRGIGDAAVLLRISIRERFGAAESLSRWRG